MFQRYWSNELAIRVCAEDPNVPGFLEHSMDSEFVKEDVVMYAE
jgi:hypothetical protein